MGAKTILSQRALGILLTCLFVSALSFVGCAPAETGQAGASDESHVDIPFRLDGHLTMSRDGEIFQEIDIEIADNDSSRTRGLMQRDALPENAGMLFIFEQEQQQGFWMANTRIALDLIFIRTDLTVQSITKYVQPMNLETVPSQGPAQYVLEVKAGYTDSIGLMEGDHIEWTRVQESLPMQDAETPDGAS
jgi:uncharacterized membrane protein (UPF0127 family)